MTKDDLKASIEKAFPTGNDGQPTAQVIKIAEDIATAIDAYVKSEFEILKTWLVVPGAFIVNSGSSDVSPGSFTNYSPGTSPQT